MIEFTELRFKNFISYSNAWTTYTFEQGITRISGINGQGKSTIVDAIYYVLFGKPFRNTNLPNLVNSRTRKNACVELSFSVPGYDFKIIRGIKPNRFEIYKTATGMEWSRKDLLPQDALKKNYQETLESIIGCSEEIFLQIGIKSMTRYGSFLTLAKGKKRSIVEEIFGLEVISEMDDLNKIMIDKMAQCIRDLKRDEANIITLIEQEQKNLQNLKRIKKEMEQNIAAENIKTNALISLVTETLDKLYDAEEKIHSKLGELKDSEGLIQDVDKKVEKLTKRINLIQTKMLSENEKIGFVQNYCETCPNIEKMKEGLNLQSLEAERDGTETDLLDFKAERMHLQNDADKLRGITDKLPELEMRIAAKEREIKGLKGTLKNETENAVIIDETQYKLHKQKLEETIKEIKDNYEDLKYHQAISTILSDDGIKSYVIGKYLPLLNKLMNTYLQKFGIDLELEFDSDLDIKINTKFKEGYSYGTFSEGEKKRIDAAMMFTFLEFCKLKNSNTSLNILILDEFSHGLDPEADSVMHDILRDISEKEGKEIITISPNPHIDPDKIDRLFHVSMNQGFSSIELVTD